MNNLAKISFRPIVDEDIGILYEIYRSTRVDEIGIASWDYKEREEFLQKQFNMQHIQYMANYKSGVFNIILYNKEPIGRLYVNRRKDDMRIIDIAFLKEFRNKGIGTQILNNLIRESEEMKVPLSLHVEYYNFARGWYERCGFKQEGETGVYIFMRRKPKSIE
ncbi:GNAT family N-acetyltransferase [Abyssisolibacter fermentans]|uniref:GNAT family N-acetyltransferase n=1 Tax=Abyssisolibacter fermentans TaxID=1766203 RepID=UPI000829D1AA|nr:GNAT family N-acetyltransferase [Abyssisolibacter fermentans]